MPSQGRLAAALVALLAVAAGCGADGPTPATSPPATTSAAASPSGASPTVASPSQPAPTFAGTLVRLTVRGGKVETASRLVKVKLGTLVRLEVTSDVTDAVHVHTYDVKKDVGAGQTVNVDFTANVPGTVKVELEQRGLLLVELKAS